MAQLRITDGSREINYNEDTKEYIKKEVYNSESNCEVIASKVAKQLDFYAIEYYLSSKYPNCCVSKNFLKQGECLITFKSILKYLRYSEIEFLSDLEDEYSIEDKIDFIWSLFVKFGVSKQDKQEFINMLRLDTLLVNTDRHLANFGVIISREGLINISPIWDTGICLRVNQDNRLAFDKSIKLKPLNVSLQELGKYFNIGYLASKINIGNLSLDDSRDLKVLKHRLNQFKVNLSSFENYLRKE